MGFMLYNLRSERSRNTLIDSSWMKDYLLNVITFLKASFFDTCSPFLRSCESTEQIELRIETIFCWWWFRTAQQIVLLILRKVILNKLLRINFEVTQAALCERFRQNLLLLTAVVLIELIRRWKHLWGDLWWTDNAGLISKIDTWGKGESWLGFLLEIFGKWHHFVTTWRYRSQRFYLNRWRKLCLFTLLGWLKFCGLITILDFWGQIKMSLLLVRSKLAQFLRYIF